ncbi:MAG: hypothetical protein E7638_04515, partial [Ruminococcaceae bacterium]|nr:hypothetical protein [Oscillospiraceae bacterium]
MKQKSIVAVLLAAQMLLVGGVACNDSGVSDDTIVSETASAETESAEIDETEDGETEFDRMSVSDDLPDITFNGRDFRIVTNEDALFQLVAEDYTGVATNDVIYDRNKRVEDRFDVKISAFYEGKEPQDVVYLYAMTDEHYVEMADVWSRMGLSLAADSLCLNW